MLPSNVRLASATTALVPAPVRTESEVKLVAPVPPLATVTVSDKVDPAAVTVMGAVPSKFTPLIALAVARAVAVAAFPCA